MYHVNLGFAPGISRPGFPGKFPKKFPPDPGIFSSGNPGNFDRKFFEFLLKSHDFQHELGQNFTKMMKTNLVLATQTTFYLISLSF